MVGPSSSNLEPRDRRIVRSHLGAVDCGSACKKSARIAVPFTFIARACGGMFEIVATKYLAAIKHPILSGWHAPHTIFGASFILPLRSCVTSFLRFAFVRANAAWMLPGFPSFFAGFLLWITFQNNCTFTPATSRIKFTYVTFPLTAYHFLQSPALTTDSLASRILFPRNVENAVTCSDWHFQFR